MQNLIEHPRRILLIDDNPSIHEDYRKILNAPARTVTSAEADFFGEPELPAAQPVDIRLDSAFQGQEALSKVKLALENQEPYSMAFVDMRMPPGWDGVKTINELWRAQPDLQVVICTAYSDSSWDDICLELGHTDQLLILKKPFDNIEVAQLAIALTKKWALTRDARLRQEDLELLVRRRTAALRIAAMQDGLTGLANRTRFNERLDQTLARNGRNADEHAVVLLIDLDCFKSINDSLGHPAGDMVVRGVANRLHQSVRESDCVARLGGDEFAILQTPVSNVDNADTLARRLFEVLEEPFEIDGHRIQVGMSCGIAVSPQDGTTIDELLKNADLAMYRAKADGRNCYRFFKEEMDQRCKHRRKTIGELKLSIEAEQFVIHYQPIICASTGRVASYEALLRWQHPTRGLLSPSEFLAAAEHAGLTDPIGAWVIRQACRDALQFPDDISISVNVSAVQFRRNSLLRSVQKALAETGLPPSRLVLEIVESVVLQKSSRVLETLDRLHQLGVGIAMDDFGTGYSSLSYLRMFPFDTIKLDRSFVLDAPDSDESVGIIRAVAMLGKCLNLKLIAEGVETKEQLECVTEIGYECVQGYYHARPMPLNEALQWELAKR